MRRFIPLALSLAMFAGALFGAVDVTYWP